MNTHEEKSQLKAEGLVVTTGLDLAELSADADDGQIKDYVVSGNKAMERCRELRLVLAFLVGDALNKAKARKELKGPEWDAWVEKTCGIKARWARSLMRIAREFGSREALPSGCSIRGALRILDGRREIRETGESAAGESAKATSRAPRKSGETTSTDGALQPVGKTVSLPPTGAPSELGDEASSLVDEIMRIIPILGDEHLDVLKKVRSLLVKAAGPSVDPPRGGKGKRPKLRVA